MILCNVIICMIFLDASNPNISKESCSTFVLIKYLFKIILNLLHCLMIWSYTVSYKTIWMWISIENVISTIWYKIQQHFTHVKSSWATSYDRKSVLLILLFNLILFCDSFVKFGVIILYLIE